MTTGREWLCRLLATFRRHRTDADLEAELHAHLELAEEDAQRRGRTSEEAVRAARRQAGGVSQALDALRDQRGLPMMDAALAGVASLPKLVRQHRGYFTFATLTLAVAVGVNLVVFTIVNALWLRPLPFPDADRLVSVLPPFIGFTRLDGPEITELRPSPFEALAGHVLNDDERGLGGPVPRLAVNGREVETLGVTAEYFGLLGAPVRGRDFTGVDDRPGAEPVAIISDRLWAREFGRRPDVLGAVVPAGPLPVRIIGIAPAKFEGARRGERTDVWIPSTLVPRAGGALGSSVTLMLFARLAPGISAAEATRLLQQKHRDWNGVAVVPLEDVYGTPTSRTILIRERDAVSVVAGLALLVLAGGCATVAALVLVHYERRRRELAVRLALGASRGRLVGELSRELLPIAATGTLGALLVAVAGLRAVPALSLPGGVNLGRLDLSVDWRVLAVGIATALLTLMAAAALPIVRFTRASLAGDLLAGPGATPSAASQRIRQALLALHVAATIVVLVAAGLFVRAVMHGFGRGAGFEFERAAFVTVDVSSPEDFSSIKQPRDWDSFDYPRLSRIRAERKARVRSAIASVPGVIDIAEGTSPIGVEPAGLLLKPSAVQAETVRHELLVGVVTGSAEVSDALGLSLLAGRRLMPADMGASPARAVVTASFAHALWPGQNPLGKTFQMPQGRFGRSEVVGLARDFVYGSFSRPATGIVVTVSSSPGGSRVHYIVRAAAPGALVESLRQAARVAMPGTPWVKVATGREIIAADLGRQRLGAWFFSGFGLTALLLGIGGVFGLVAYLAESRRRELGVRLALGATPRDLVHHGVAAALVPVACGVAGGLVSAALVARLFTSLLTGLSALDPFTYATVGVTLLGCAGLAGLAGAWRLRTMTPMDALRAE